jgi:diaminopimelate epimerase
VAAALAARALAKEEGRDTWTVDVPGGRLQVVVTGDLVAGASVELIGPAVIVADGVLTGA